MNALMGGSASNHPFRATAALTAAAPRSLAAPRGAK
jgi:hypothetical protein